MPSNKNIVNSSPNSNSSNEEEKFVLRSFKVKPAGHGTTKNTLVENDSLSSYSWPDETSRPNGARRQSSEKILKMLKYDLINLAVLIIL